MTTKNTGRDRWHGGDPKDLHQSIPYRDSFQH
jgi:hypothetical protein